MKKFALAFVIVFAVALLAGCNAKNNTNFDNADTASFDAATDTEAQDPGNPPIPPEPTDGSTQAAE